MLSKELLLIEKLTKRIEQLERNFLEVSNLQSRTIIALIDDFKRFETQASNNVKPGGVEFEKDFIRIRLGQVTIPSTNNANPKTKAAFINFIKNTFKANKQKDKVICYKAGVNLHLYFKYYHTNMDIDVDNIIKSVLDSLKGILYADDKQIYKLIIEKEEVAECDRRIEISVKKI